MADKFAKFYDNIDSPATHGLLITPSDGANLAFSTRHIYIGNTGNVNCIFVGDTANTVIPFAPSGAQFPYRIVKIWASGTTATNIVGAW
jgi:hypothetical protein